MARRLCRPGPRWIHQDGANRPDFTANQIHVTCGYEATTKVQGPPKTDPSIRDVDMVPTVRQALLAKAAQAKAAGGDTGLVFHRKDGRIIAYSTMSWAWREAVEAARVRPIRTYDMRHIYASLLIMAGKNALYISKQMGHHDPDFTYKVYGHLLESLPKRQVEWIDELVFPEGFQRALKAHAAAPLQSADALLEAQVRPATKNPR